MVQQKIYMMQWELNFRRKGFFRNPADPYFIAHQAEKHFLTTPTEIKNENGKKVIKVIFLSCTQGQLKFQLVLWLDKNHSNTKN